MGDSILIRRGRQFVVATTDRIQCLCKAVIRRSRDLQHHHCQFPRTWTAPHQHRVVDQVVLLEMQLVLEHLRNMLDLEDRYMLQVWRTFANCVPSFTFYDHTAKEGASCD